MKYLFFIVGVGLIALSLISCTAAKTSINEIASLVMLLTGIICMAAGSLLDAVESVREALQKPGPGPH